MGKASSSKKVARAAKAAGRPGAKKSYAWPMTMGAVVIAGVVLIVLTVSGGDNAVAGAPRIDEDHWHAAYGIYNCKAYTAPLKDISDQDPLGIHTHGEGLMHMHPFSPRSEGKGANLFHFGEQTGMKVTDTSLKTPKVSVKNGDKCGGKPGHVELVTWSNPADKTPKVIRKNIADYAPKDQSVWALAFVADGQTVPMPPSVTGLADPTAAEEGRAPTTPSTVQITPSTTAPPGTTATTAAP
jgi:hypothetical protein